MIRNTWNENPRPLHRALTVRTLEAALTRAQEGVVCRGRKIHGSRAGPFQKLPPRVVSALRHCFPRFIEIELTYKIVEVEGVHHDLSGLWLLTRVSGPGQGAGAVVECGKQRLSCLSLQRAGALGRGEVSSQPRGESGS